jgi:hypothetical protein
LPRTLAARIVIVATGRIITTNARGAIYRGATPVRAAARIIITSAVAIAVIAAVRIAIGNAHINATITVTAIAISIFV